MPDHLEGGRHIIKNFGDVLAKLAEGTAAVRTGAGGLVDLLLAREMFGQRLAVSGAEPADRPDRFRERLRTVLAQQSLPSI